MSNKEETNKKKTPAFKAHLKRIASKGGKNKKGTKNKTTIEREKVLEMAKDIIAGRTRKLIDTQTNLAMGAIKIFCIHSHWEGSGKKRTLIRDKAYLVDDDEAIQKVIDYEYGDGEDPNEHDQEDKEFDYYFVVTKDPDNTAIKDLLDRTFGKATENKNITVEKGMGDILLELDQEDE